MEKREIHLMLHNIRSAHNVGSIFRTSDAIGVTHVYFSGYTPLPVDKFGRPSKEIAKTALGSEKIIPWTRVSSPARLIERSKSEGYVVIAIEQDARAVDYKTYLPPTGKSLVLVGNEVRGLAKALRDRADVVVDIPMRGAKESLNVAVAYGVAMFRLFDQERY
jgi:tRNA G18 (ribose-2'-O)-methylase SpoU